MKGQNLQMFNIILIMFPQLQELEKMENWEHNLDNFYYSQFFVKDFKS